MHYFETRDKLLNAWYELRVDFSEKSNLIVDIHGKAWKFCLESFGIGRVYRGFSEGLEIPKFILPGSKSGWGFGEILSKRRFDREGWISFECLLPSFSANSSEVVWDKLFSISATLNVLFTCLLVFDEEIEDYYSPQLLAINGIITERDMNGGAISAFLSKELCEFIAKEIDLQGEEIRYSPVISAMEVAYKYVSGEEASYMDFRAMLRRPKWLNLSVPGNACGLDPANYYDADSFKGYEMLPHNVDGPLQQIYLLAGLFAFYDYARKWRWLDLYEEKIAEALSESSLLVSYSIAADITALFHQRPFSGICAIDGKVSLEEIKKRYGKR